MRTNVKSAPALRLNLSAEEYKAFRHYLIEHEVSASEFVSGYIRKILGRESKTSTGQQLSIEEGRVVE